MESAPVIVLPVSNRSVEFCTIYEIQASVPGVHYHFMSNIHEQVSEYNGTSTGNKKNMKE